MHQYTATDASSAIYAGRLPFPVSRQPGPAGPQPKGKPMTGTSLQHFINRIRAVWGPLSSALVAERSEEHTSELQSLMRISYAVFCLKKKTYTEHQLRIQLIPHVKQVHHYSP